MVTPSSKLPHGVILRCLDAHDDERGRFAELYRREWHTGIDPVQWNVVRSAANVLRGVHLHVAHSDYLLVADGAMVLGLHDARDKSPTRGLSATIRLTADLRNTVFIPTGVAHGFYFPVPSIHLYATSHYWNVADELGCRWNDPELAIDWPCSAPMLSSRDQAAGSLAEALELYRARDLQTRRGA